MHSVIMKTSDFQLQWGSKIQPFKTRKYLKMGHSKSGSEDPQTRQIVGFSDPM